MADDNKDDDKHGTGTGPTVDPSPKKAGEEPGHKNTTYGGGQQAKASKKQNFKGGDPDQDTHK